MYILHGRGMRLLTGRSMERRRIVGRGKRGRGMEGSDIAGRDVAGFFVTSDGNVLGDEIGSHAGSIYDRPYFGFDRIKSGLQVC